MTETLTVSLWFRDVGWPLTPWLLYVTGTVFGLLTRGRSERKVWGWLAGACFLFGTVVMMFHIF
jgi:hypothetical protein